MTALQIRSFRSRPLLGLFLAPLGLISAGADAQSLGVCNSFYSSGFTLTEGKVNPTMPSLAKPAKGTVLKEPNFNTCLVRATVHDTEPPSTFARTDYSRRQSFNANNTYFIVYSNDGWWHLYNATTLQYLRKLSPKVANSSVSAEFHMAGDAEPQWHPTDPNSLYYVPNNGGTKLLKLDVRTNTHTVAADFAGKLPSWASSAAHIWTKSEGSPSADGRYWGFQVENSSFGLLGYMVWDLQNNRLVGSRQDNSRPDHSSMSAAGRWYITSSDTTGTWAWSPDFTKKKKLHNKSEHSDMALGPNGQDYYVSVDYQSSAGDVFFTDIDACPAVAASVTTAPVCPRTVLFPSYINGAATAMHFSGKSFSKPGWMIWSTYATTASRDGSWPWFTNKIYAVELKANPRVYPIAYTRRAESAGGYWSEPHATVSRDFTRIAFNSNWHVNNANDIDTYIVHIPQSALPGGTTTPAPTASRVTGGNLPPSLGTAAATAAAPVSSGAQVSQSPATGGSDSGTASGTSTGTATDAGTTGQPARFVSRGERVLRSGALLARNLGLLDGTSIRAALWSLPGASLFDDDDTFELESERERKRNRR
ncbi:hypothetical protein [Pseudoxanthomonas wuyuanensis]|uniref:BNR repeat-containing family member n=1 Tax=Pseudoxanthomonas wuyuanensis TaxID=1073196 RepID=A0A286D9G7_9GAMM|nr:hypothetical protein [Pseudoxanthomonas wuyuanensis]SOD55267.1 hypothetical protein SAMN06296416_106235 [Pseudoxanthomonas wuyuanensis]